MHSAGVLLLGAGKAGGRTFAKMRPPDWKGSKMPACDLADQA
jgi:hypothetical protein